MQGKTEGCWDIKECGGDRSAGVEPGESGGVEAGAVGDSAMREVRGGAALWQEGRRISDGTPLHLSLPTDYFRHVRDS